MTTFIISPHLLFSAIILALAITNSLADNHTDSNGSNLLVLANNTRHFSNHFYKTLSNDSKKNFGYSPFSLHILLCLLYFGTNGTTKEQLKSSLNLPHEDFITKSGYQHIIDSLNNVTGAELRFVNKLFSAKEYELKPEYKEITKTYFRSESENVDFKNQTEVTAGTINNWCANKTNNRITEILKPDDLVDAVLVLTNAIHFKGIWKKKFNPLNTINRTFYTSPESSVNVTMMRARSYFYWGLIPELDASFIKIPYQTDEALTMYVILPKKKDGLEYAESNFGNIYLGDLHGYKSDVILELPKFEIESTFDSIPILRQMNITEIFSPKADFSGINAEKGLYVSKIIQKAFIKVNEEGSEAAAISAGVTLAKKNRVLIMPKSFIVDRPFMFAIVHEDTNAVLFLGHVYNPNEN